MAPGQAAALAFDCCVAAWIDHHHVASPPGRCLVCGGGQSANDDLQAYGVAPARLAVVHTRCWPRWWTSLKVGAAAALGPILGFTPDNPVT